MTRIGLLGTGSADGWPNPFCRCASCQALRERREVRAHSATLLDDVLLVDLGPDVPRSAERHGFRLDGVQVVLLTHAHPDHVDPLALLARHWAGSNQPLTVAGPPAAVAECRPWLAPADDVEVVELSPGDTLERSGYRVEALAARHDGPEAGPALVYRITSPDGAGILYATDTGQLPEPTYRALAGTRLDAVLLELSFGDRLEHATDHLDLRAFPTVLARLRRDGVVTSSTTVVATHLSHHNPPDLADVVAAWQVSVPPDGAVLEVGPAAPRPTRQAPVRRTLVLGGARSGKSSHAERLLAAEPAVTYVATGGGRPDDDEWVTRVAAHRARRPAHWTTVESTDLAHLLDNAADGDVLLIDCLTLWLTAVLDATDSWHDPALAAKRAAPRIDQLVEAWRTTRAHVVAVANEVGSGLVPDTHAGRLFRDLQGRLNAQMARHSEVVHLVVAGRVLDLGSGHSAAPWPST